jgi:hypothetical protein
VWKLERPSYMSGYDRSVFVDCYYGVNREAAGELGGLRRSSLRVWEI